jgi:DNA repair protein RadC
MCLLRDWPEYERPRERVLIHGPRALTDAELLALVIGGGAKNAGAVATCRSLLRRFGGLPALADAHAEELRETDGIGKARACALVALGELARRLAAQTIRRGDPIRNSEDAYRRLKASLSRLGQELFVVMALDAKQRLISIFQIAQGGATSVEVHPREVFAPLIRARACGALVAHNHPSGDPEPSEDDLHLTHRLRSAGELLGIPLLDHIVVGDDCYRSIGELAGF